MRKAKESQEGAINSEVVEALETWRVKEESYGHSNEEKLESLDKLLNELGPDGKKLITEDEMNQIKEDEEAKMGS